MILRDSRGILSDDLIWCSQGISRDMVLGHLMASWEGIWGLRGVPGPLWPLVALSIPRVYYCVYMYTPAMRLSPYVTRSLSDGARGSTTCTTRPSACTSTCRGSSPGTPQTTIYPSDGNNHVCAQHSLSCMPSDVFWPFGVFRGQPGTPLVRYGEYHVVHIWTYALPQRLIVVYPRTLFCTRRSCGSPL